MNFKEFLETKLNESYDADYNYEEQEARIEFKNRLITLKYNKREKSIEINDDDEKSTDIDPKEKELAKELVDWIGMNIKDAKEIANDFFDIIVN